MTIELSAPPFKIEPGATYVLELDGHHSAEALLALKEAAEPLSQALGCKFLVLPKGTSIKREEINTAFLCAHCGIEQPESMRCYTWCTDCIDKLLAGPCSCNLCVAVTRRALKLAGA
jgi:hypothetical protein